MVYCEKEKNTKAVKKTGAENKSYVNAARKKEKSNKAKNKKNKKNKKEKKRLL